MDREKQINFAGSVIIFFVLLFAFAKWGPAIPFSVSSQTKGEPFIVSGEGKVAATPDTVKLSFGIEENGSSLKSVQDSVNKKSKALVDVLKKMGIDEKDIKTTSYNVYPNYDYNVSPQRITGYKVSTQYTATIKDFEKVNDAITAVTQAGANIVGGVSFELSEEAKNEKLNEAREEAVKKAKEKAEGLAGASGISLGRITNVSESQGTSYPGPIMLERAKVIDGSGGEPIAQPDIQPGETEISVSVSLSYEVR